MDYLSADSRSTIGLVACLVSRVIQAHVKDEALSELIKLTQEFREEKARLAKPRQERRACPFGSPSLGSVNEDM